LSRQRELRRLELRNCQVHADAFRALENHAKNLTHLNVSLSGDEASVRKSVASAAAKMPQLTALSASPLLDTAALALLAGHPRLANLYQVSVKDDARGVFNELARLPKLSHISVWGSELDAKEAEMLSRLPLQSIQWIRGNVESALMDAFAQNSELRKLDFISIVPGDNFVDELKELRSLESLSLSFRDSAPRSKALQRALLTLPRLKEWPHIDYIYRDTLKQLRNHSNIQHLSVYQVARDVTKEDLKNIFELKQLRSLSLDCVPLDGDLTRRFESLSTLEELTLAHTGSDLAGLPSLRKLRRLVLHLNSPTQTDLSAVAKLPALEDLQLSGVNLQPVQLKPLQHCPKLNRLFLASGVHVDDATADWLCANPKLVWLQMREPCIVSDRSAKRLASLPNLQHLQIAGAISSETVERLANAPGIRMLRVNTHAIAQAERATLQKRFAALKRCYIQPLNVVNVGSDGIIRKAARNRKLWDDLEGNPAPAFDSPAVTSAESVRLESLRGKVVLLDFLGTWCDGFLMAFPEIRRLQQRFGDDDFEVIGVHSEHKAEEAPAYLKKNPLTWSNIVDPGHLAESYGVTGYPAYFLIDRNGKLRVAGASIMGLERGIEILLDETRNVGNEQRHAENVARNSDDTES
ncbi:MAG: TlpA disulfide reductase family protein, partial [Planctomycetota bacterium]